ncbi:adenylate/guanylate cyclase domain-containing protein [candidate division KSB1 bacterium]
MGTALSSQKILVVDDAPENIHILMETLKGDYKMVAAKNGEKALAIAGGENPPDIILLDIMMPEMDGYEVCRRLKENERTRKIPVIFITAKSEVEDEQKGLEYGAVDYITKPISPPIVKARVKNHLELKIRREELEILANKLSKYLSPEVYNLIFTGEKDVKIESYRKYLTVFFSDIVEFTPKTEEMDHQELTKWLNNYLNEMAGIALKHGGTLDKFIGDAVMVFFGDPKTGGHEIDAVNCVNMALEMQSRAKEMGVEIRVGINSGECTVGNFGSAERMEYTIIGKEVNAASRLEKNSEPGKILISDNTFKLVNNSVSCESRGEIHLKGIERDIMTYWVSEKKD